MHPKSIFCVALQINYIIDTNCVITHRGTGTAMRKICKQVGRKYKIIFFSIFFSSLLLPHRSFSTRSILNKQLRKKKRWNECYSINSYIVTHTYENKWISYRYQIILYIRKQGFLYNKQNRNLFLLPVFCRRTNFAILCLFIIKIGVLCLTAVAFFVSIYFTMNRN